MDEVGSLNLIQSYQTSANQTLNTFRCFSTKLLRQDWLFDGLFTSFKSKVFLCNLNKFTSFALIMYAITIRGDTIPSF